MMRRSTWFSGVGAKFVIDAVALISFALVTSTGFLLYLVLPHGSGSLQGRGALRHGVTLLWGLDRRQWGDVHLILCLVLLAVLLIHLAQHWKRVKGYFLNKMPTPFRIGLLLLLLLITIASFAPFMVATTIYTPDLAEVKMRGRHGGGALQGDPTGETAENRAGGKGRQAEIQVRGRDTIADAAVRLNVPASQVKEALGLPDSIADDTRMSIVKSRLGLTMSDVRRKLDSL